MKRDELGDRMKGYEAVETDRRLDPSIPMVARIDGRCFSSFTRGMRQPYEPRLMEAMQAVAEYLLGISNALIAYTQSDEINLVWAPIAEPSEPLFGAKVHKLTSVLASEAAARMALEIRGWEPYCGRAPAFDARVFNVPNLSEASNMLLWRNRDATRNAIQSAARAHFSHKECHGKNQKDLLLMLRGRGVNVHWDYPDSFRFGTYIRPATIRRPMTEEELRRIPEKHRTSSLVTRRFYGRWSTPDRLDLEQYVESPGAAPKRVRKDEFIAAISEQSSEYKKKTNA